MGAVKANFKWIALGAVLGYFVVPFAVNAVKNRR
jgi:hypothetical protein